MQRSLADLVDDKDVFDKLFLQTGIDLTTEDTGEYTPMQMADKEADRLARERLTLAGALGMLEEPGQQFDQSAKGDAEAKRRAYLLRKHCWYTNRYYETRSGLPVILYAVYKKGHWPLHGAYYARKSWYCTMWNRAGINYDPDGDRLDIVIVKDKDGLHTDIYPGEDSGSCPDAN